MQHLLPHFAAIPHECFVEPFCGTCSVLMAKPRSKGEVVNDLDGELVNALRQIQHHPKELRRELRWVPNSREEFNARKAQPGLTEIQRAATYLSLNNISFGGDNASYGVTCSGGGGGAHTPASRITRQIIALHARLDRVSIERLDWKRCIELYDRPTTLFFCDPPYIGCDCKAYDAFTAAQVQELRDVLHAIQGRWVVTLNDSPEVRGIFTGCQFTEIKRGNNFRSGKNRSAKATAYPEVVITAAP